MPSPSFLLPLVSFLPYGITRASKSKGAESMASEMIRYGKGRIVVVFSIVILSLLDSFFTIHLVQNGAEELNPILSFYLEHGHMAFFAVKYFLTTATIFIILGGETVFGPRLRLPANFLFGFYIIVLALVVYWEVYLLFL